MFDNLDDPRQQALLAAAFGLLGGQGGKGFGGFARDVGQAGLLGLNRFAVANEDKRRNSAADMQKKMLEEQYKQTQRANEYQNNFDALAKRHFNQGSPATPEMISDDFTGSPYPAQPAQAPKADFQGFMSGLPGLGGQGVKDAIALKQSMAKDNAFGKVDAKDYTADSVRKFIASGGRDYSILVPVRKLDNVDGRATNLYSDQTPAGADLVGPQSKVIKNAKGEWGYNPALISPVDWGQLQNAQANTGINLARARDEGIGGLPGLPGFMTGGVSGPIQRGGPVPQPAPQNAPTAPVEAPVSAPAGVPVLSPKQAREIAAKTAEKRALDKVAAQSSLPNVTAEATQTLKLIDKMVAHPGLGDVVGAKWSGGLTTMFGLPPMAGTEAADFETMREQLTGKQFLQAYESLKGSGQITEIEGAKATNAIARMQTAQSEKAFKEAAQEFRDVIESGLSRARDKAGASGESQAAPQTKPVKIGNKQYEAKIGKWGKYYVQIGSRYFEVSE